mmetsp:Transcript_76611/g.192779  ORF Transcript_76611/g.192779 Transcript_76611/m.192779 type:complete len:248 (-) Transcript_76611:291-1034(-)
MRATHDEMRSTARIVTTRRPTSMCGSNVTWWRRAPPRLPTCGSMMAGSMPPPKIDLRSFCLPTHLSKIAPPSAASTTWNSVSETLHTEAKCAWLPPVKSWQTPPGANATSASSASSGPLSGEKMLMYSETSVEPSSRGRQTWTCMRGSFREFKTVCVAKAFLSLPRSIPTSDGSEMTRRSWRCCGADWAVGNGTSGENGFVPGDRGSGVLNLLAGLLGGRSTGSDRALALVVQALLASRRVPFALLP